MEMRLAPQKRRRQQRRRRYTIIAVILVIIILVFGYFMTVNQPRADAKSQITHKAQKAQKIKYVDHFYRVSRSHTYYSVTGKNKDNQTVGVINRKGSNKLTTVKMADGLSAKDIQQTVKNNYPVKKITSLGLATYEGVPVWDVTFIDKRDNLNFMTYQFKDGKVLRSVQNF